LGLLTLGTYSAHWEAYKKQSLRWLVRLALLIVVGLPATALVAFAVERVTGTFPAYLQLGLLAIWLVALIVAATRASRVTCPRCATVYARGKGLCNCPQCGLRLLQEEP
jgi:hypothetical protein